MCPADYQWHPATSEFFYRNKKGRDGFNTPCKQCQKNGKRHPIEVLPEGYKRCTDCKELKPLTEFSPLDKRTLAKRPQTSKQMGRRPDCKECRAKHSREYVKNHPRVRKPGPFKSYPETSRRHKLERNYGITDEDYQRFFDEQNGVCAICGQPETATMKRTGKLRKLSVGHCHKTGKIRALLCTGCNQAYGCLREDPVRIRALLAYAEKWRAHT
jgi:hypothetical protein